MYFSPIKVEIMEGQGVVLSVLRLWLLVVCRQAIPVALRQVASRETHARWTISLTLITLEYNIRDTAKLVLFARGPGAGEARLPATTPPTRAAASLLCRGRQDAYHARRTCCQEQDKSSRTGDAALTNRGGLGTPKNFDCSLLQAYG